jgi:hypothetical protein
MKTSNQLSAETKRIQWFLEKSGPHSPLSALKAIQYTAPYLSLQRAVDALDYFWPDLEQKDKPEEWAFIRSTHFKALYGLFGLSVVDYTNDPVNVQSTPIESSDTGINYDWMYEPYQVLVEVDPFQMNICQYRQWIVEIYDSID